EEFVVTTASTIYHARAVVIATGYREPVIPEFSSKLSSDIFQIHSSMYKNPTQVPKGTVLVVGRGNSAAQIAIELSKTHEVTMSLSRMPRTISPKTFTKS